MTWHRGNLLKSIGETSYLYDAQGTRYAKTKGNERTEYFRDGGKIIEEHRGNARIRYLYDAEGIMGFKVYQEYYYFLKDVQGNVRSVIRAHQNIAQAGFVVDEVARYEYDAWGNATSSNFNNAKIDGVDVAEFNPIRWKSQYYDTESGLYYINGRYYSPETKRYVDSGNPETALANAATIYGLNLQNSTLTNPVNELYNEYTIETQTALTYDPPKLTKWQAFWRSDWGKATAALLLFVATVLTLEFSLAFPIAAGAIWAGYGMTFGLTAVSLGVGAAIAGYRSSRQGKGFWNGFGEYIHDNWAQEAAITSALYIVSIGISLTKYAIANAVSKKANQKLTLYHYTNEKGLNGIVNSNKLNPSLKANNLKDARHGNGQYLTDIAPNNTTPTKLAKKLINVPNKYKFTHYIEINVSGLNIIKGRNGVYVILNEEALDLTGRIISTGILGG